MDKKFPDYTYSERASVWEKHKRFKKSLKVEEKISRKNFKTRANTGTSRNNEFKSSII